MGSQPTRSEIRAALDALKVNVPFYSAEGTKGGGVCFRLYGGRVVEFSETVGSGEATSPFVVAGGDLARIRGVGKVTAGALVAAGFVSLEDLDGASDEALLEVVNAGTVSKIRAYLREEYAQ